VDAAQIDQVLLNLVVNARDAMPGGGRIEIETADVNAAGEVVTGTGDAPGTHVRLRVRDTGTGITPEALAHLFEPFFTTKPAGKGTGLGLSTASSIVTRSGGTMRAESAPGVGAAFDVILPRATVGPAFAALAPPTAPTPKAASGAAETILVVEDEAPIRRFLRLLLESLGYRVLEAPDGPEALSLAATLPRVDLLVSDVVMPRMSGPLLACRLREAHPELAILFISGYIESEAGGEASPPGARFLEKPFTREELARAVRELLDARAGVAIGI
jgi:CheY-like chemotaxis protein